MYVYGVIYHDGWPAMAIALPNAHGTHAVVPLTDFVDIEPAEHGLHVIEPYDT